MAGEGDRSGNGMTAASSVGSERVAQPQRLAFSVDEAAGMLGISRDLAYDLARQGQLRTVRLGRRRVVPRVALEEILDGAVSGAFDTDA